MMTSRNSIRTVCLIALTFAHTVILAEDSTAPLQRFAVDLIPGEVRAVGCTGPERGRQATRVAIELKLEFGPYVEQPFRRDVLIEADGIDVARIPVEIESVSPGQVTIQHLSIYLPRSLPVGRVTLCGGLLPTDAPAESRNLRSARLTSLWEMEVEEAAIPPAMSEQSRRSLLGRRSHAEQIGILVNGGFEEELAAWNVDEIILAGENGWSRLFAIAVDDSCALEGKRSLRIDFAGGQDMDLWHIQQDVPVEPNAKYTLSYFVRTENISSRNGPLLSVESIGTANSRYFVAAPAELRLTGSQEWTYVEIPFESRATDGAMRIRVRRSKESVKATVPRHRGEIEGSAWFDGIRITRTDERR